MTGPITEFRPVQDGTPAAGSLLARLEAVHAELAHAFTPSETQRGLARFAKIIRDLEQDVDLTPAEPQKDDTTSLLQALVDEVRGLRAQMGSTAGVSSVELSVDSKALVKPVVKVYDTDPDVASAKAQEIFDACVIKYGEHAKNAKNGNGA